MIGDRQVAKIGLRLSLATNARNQTDRLVDLATKMGDLARLCDVQHGIDACTLACLLLSIGIGACTARTRAVTVT